MIRQAAAQLGFAPNFFIWIDCRILINCKIAARNVTQHPLPTNALWSVIVTGPPKTRANIDRLIREDFPGLVPRLKVFPDPGEADAILKNARKRDLILPLDAGDILAADALFEFACELNTNDTTDFLYGDERRPNVTTDRVEAFFKPDWSPTLLFSSNYIGGPGARRWSVPATERSGIQHNSTAGNFSHVSCTYRTRRQSCPRPTRSRGDKVPTAIRDGRAEVQALGTALRRRQITDRWKTGM